MSEPFDFDAFIRGTSLARRTVSAYRVDNRDAIERLKAEHDAAPAGDDDREFSGSSDRDGIEQQIADLRAEMEASRVEWTIRTLGPVEFKAVINAADDEPFDQMAMMSRAPEGCANPGLYNDLPNLTADQWRQIAGAIGTAQWSVIVDDANSLVMSKVAVPDFSRPSSTTRTPLGLSEN